MATSSETVRFARPNRNVGGSDVAAATPLALVTAIDPAAATPVGALVDRSVLEPFGSAHPPVSTVIIAAIQATVLFNGVFIVSLRL